ncbi:MAG: phage major tail tube protein [Chthoniobacteraceae bacterium]
MSAADQILKNLNLFADGYGFAGNITDFTPPALKITEVAYNAGGLDTPINLDMGLQALTCSFSLSKFSPQVFKLWGLTDASGKQFTVRGAVESLNGTVEPIVIRMTGNLRQIEPGTWKPGAVLSAKFTVSLLAYTFEQNGTTIHDIDVLNMKRVINGVDQLSAVRTAIGI